MSLPPGTIEIRFTLAGEDARQFRLMARASKQSEAKLAKSMIRELLADDRAAHSEQRSAGVEIRTGMPA